MGARDDGIHGHHLNPGVHISYVAIDNKRQVIPQVTYTDPSGKTTVYNSTDTKATPEQLAAGEHRVMDCMDCHNRPTHTFQLPDEALDQAMSRRLISTDLPFIKKQALAALKVDYPDRRTARDANRADAAKFLSRELSERGRLAGPAVNRRDSGSAADLLAQCVSQNERHLGHLYQQFGAHELARMFPLPRWQPRLERWQNHSQRLRHLPHIFWRWSEHNPKDSRGYGNEVIHGRTPIVIGRATERPADWREHALEPRGGLFPRFPRPIRSRAANSECLACHGQQTLSKQAGHSVYVNGDKQKSQRSRRSGLHGLPHGHQRLSASRASGRRQLRQLPRRRSQRRFRKRPRQSLRKSLPGCHGESAHDRAGERSAIAGLRAEYP